MSNNVSLMSSLMSNNSFIDEQQRFIDEQQRFIDEQQRFIDEQQRFIDEQQQFIDEQQQFIDEQQRFIDKQQRFIVSLMSNNSSLMSNNGSLMNNSSLMSNKVQRFLAYYLCSILTFVFMEKYRQFIVKSINLFGINYHSLTDRLGQYWCFTKKQPANLPMISSLIRKKQTFACHNIKLSNLIDLLILTFCIFSKL